MGDIAVATCGEASDAPLAPATEQAGDRGRVPSRSGSPLFPLQLQRQPGGECRGVPWYRLTAHPFAFDLQQIEERAMPHGWLSQTSSVPRTPGAGEAAEGP